MISGLLNCNSVWLWSTALETLLMWSVIQALGSWWPVTLSTQQALALITRKCQNTDGLSLYGLHWSVLSRCELAVCEAEQTWVRVREAWACWHPALVNFCQCSFPIRFFQQMLSKCRRDLFLEIEVGVGRVGGSEWQSKFPYFILKAEFPRLAEKRNKCFLDPGGSTFPETEWFIFNSDSSLELLNQKSSDSFIVLRNKGSKLWAMLRLKNLECCRKGEGRFIHLIPAESSPARAWPELQGQHPEARFGSGWKSVWNSTGFHVGVSLDWLRQPSFNSLA